MVPTTGDLQSMHRYIFLVRAGSRSAPRDLNPDDFFELRYCALNAFFVNFVSDQSSTWDIKEKVCDFKRDKPALSLPNLYWFLCFSSAVRLITERLNSGKNSFFFFFFFFFFHTYRTFILNTAYHMQRKFLFNLQQIECPTDIVWIPWSWKKVIVVRKCACLVSRWNFYFVSNFNLLYLSCRFWFWWMANNCWKSKLCEMPILDTYLHSLSLWETLFVARKWKNKQYNLDFFSSVKFL